MASPPTDQQRRWVAAAGVAGTGMALVAAFTTPFTVGADAVTAVPLAAVVVVTVVTIVTPRRDPGAGRRARRGRSLPPLGGLWWCGPGLAVTGWELYCYVSCPGSTIPP